MESLDYNIIHSYDNNLYSIKQTINQYMNEISRLEDDNSEIQSNISNFEALITTMNESISKIKTRMSFFSQLASIPLAFIKPSFLDNRLSELLSGADYNSAYTSINNIIDKLNAQHTANNNKIKEYYSLIGELNNSWNSLNFQKNEYIERCSINSEGVVLK